MTSRGEKPEDPSRDAAARAERLRRLAEAMEAALPEGTRDENPEGWGEKQDGDADDWLRGQVPPHHG